MGVEKNQARNCERFTEDIRFRTETSACGIRDRNNRNLLEIVRLYNLPYKETILELLYEHVYKCTVLYVCMYESPVMDPPIEVVAFPFPRQWKIHMYLSKSYYQFKEVRNKYRC